jgi:hypothetical protein
MLEGVIQNNDIGSLRDRFPDTAWTIARCDHRNVGIQSLMNERFVPAITSQHNRGLDSALRQSARDPGSDRSLSGPANREITHAHYGNRKIFGRQHT